MRILLFLTLGMPAGFLFAGLLVYPFLEMTFLERVITLLIYGVIKTLGALGAFEGLKSVFLYLWCFACRHIGLLRKLQKKAKVYTVRTPKWLLGVTRWMPLWLRALLHAILGPCLPGGFTLNIILGKELYGRISVILFCVSVVAWSIALAWFAELIAILGLGPKDLERFFFWVTHK